MAPAGAGAGGAPGDRDEALGPQEQDGQPVADGVATGGQVGDEAELTVDAVEAELVAEAELLSAAAQVERQRDDYYNSLLRLQAEFDNYRKRVERQRLETVELAATSLVKKLLPILDTADLALAHGAGEDVKHVAGALFDVLSKEGLERIVPEGQPFDPEHHDAVAHEPADGAGAPPQPEVSEVLRAGYLWKGRVLRPAMVKVRG
jgi:molecular chaperone GrpE